MIDKRVIALKMIIMDFNIFANLHLVEGRTLTSLKAIRTAYTAYCLQHLKEECSQAEIYNSIKKYWPMVVKKYGFLGLPFFMIGKKVDWANLFNLEKEIQLSKQEQVLYDNLKEGKFNDLEIHCLVKSKVLNQTLMNKFVHKMMCRKE